MTEFDPKTSQFGLRDRDAINDLLELTKENNKYLRKMNARERNANIYRVVKWVALVIFALWAWSLIQPVVESAADAVSAFSGNVEAGQENIAELQANLDRLQNLLPNFGRTE